jgi:biopolymer transport protein ExbB
LLTFLSFPLRPAAEALHSLRNGKAGTFSMDAIEFLQKGGVVMMILALLSVYAITVIAYKVQQFVSANVFSNYFIDPVMQLVRGGELTDAGQRLQPVRGPVARIMRTAIECVRDRNMSLRSREAEISRVGAQEIHYLESHMRGLEMVATTAPLLGLLGTVIGMVRAFARLGEAGTRVDPSMLAGGIWEALLTTVGGLIVAIPAVAAYYIIDSVIEKIRTTMKDVTIQILALEDNFLRNEEEQKRVESEERQLVAQRKLHAEQRQFNEEQRRMMVQQQQDVMKKQQEQLRMLQERQTKALTDREEELHQSLKKQEQKLRKQLQEHDDKLRKSLEDQERQLSSIGGSPQSTSTLRLLNPTYGKF